MSTTQTVGEFRLGQFSGRQTVEMPGGGEIVGFAVHREEFIVYATVRSGDPLVTRSFHIAASHEQVVCEDADVVHRATCVFPHGPYAWHLFEFVASP